MKHVPNSVTRTFARTILKTRKNSPHILFAAGLAGIVGSAFLACRATLKLEENLDEIKDDLEAVKGKIVYAKSSGEVYTDQDYYKDLAFVYSKSCVKLGRLYGPSVVLGTVSVFALTGSHVQLTNRNAALTVTLASVSKAYDEYRLRIQQEIGKERELEIHRGIKNELVEVNGKSELVEAVEDPTRYSIYARIFDEGNPLYSKMPEENRIMIQVQQNYANYRLQSKGHVFLNEVYDWLGFDHTKAGAVVGWLYKDTGDGYIDFGLFEACASDFINGYERSIILDFNVDGPIWDKI